MKIPKSAWTVLPWSIAVAFIGFFLGYFGAAFRFNPPTTPGDTGAWAGAIGTVGTLVGTIWLATAAERRRMREESARAVVAAHALALRISLARKLASEAKEELE